MTDRKAAPYLENGIIYQLFPRVFTPEGTLSAAAKMLPHIKNIGADIVYLCPCFVADDDPDTEGWSKRQNASGLNNPKNPYRISDYYNVDPEYGTNEDLKNFVEKAHAIGLRVIFDLVYFHCGPTSVFLAEHPDFILRDDDGKPKVGEWRFPILNYASEELREYLIRNMELFVREYDVDGYRCDVGDLVPLDFWAKARERIDALKPGLMMLNEGTKPGYLDVFDLNYIWNFRAAFRGCVEDRKPVSTIIETLQNFNRVNLKCTYRSIMLLENHDTSNNDYENRLEKVVGHQAMDAGLVINFTLPNVPFLYNGTEVCDENRHSIWGNRFHGANLTIDWQHALTEDGRSRLDLIRSLSCLRHENPALGMSGGLEYIETGSDRVLAYARTYMRTYMRTYESEKIAVIVNLGDKNESITLDIKAKTAESSLSYGAVVSVAETGYILAKFEPYGFAVLKLS